MNLRVFQDGAAVAAAALERVVETLKKAPGEHATLVLAGGSTPRALYELLAADPVRADWSRAHVLFGDERCVPPEHDDSNYRMARESMLDALAEAGVLPSERVLRMAGELPPAQAAADYSSGLATLFSGPPRFDLVLLGMGGDGHTASLFPHTDALDAPPDRWVVENHVPKLDVNRITLTAHAINAARDVLFLVTGAGKASALAQVIAGARNTSLYPSQLIAPTDGTLTFFVDEAAAAELPPGARS